MAYEKCSMSGEVQMLTWHPDASTSYPGAVICLGCSGGILVRKGTVHSATSQAGYDGYAGTVRTHYVDAQKDSIRYRKPKEE